MKNLLTISFPVILLWACGTEPKIGNNSYVRMEYEPAGENCAAGGYKILVGTDLNSNDLLDANEVQSSEYVCNGLNAVNNLLNVLPEESSENCPEGGYKIISGIDLNGDNILSENEIENTAYICNGADGTNGYNSLINVIPEPKSENCIQGGYKIKVGMDLNYNDTLDMDEVQTIEYICNRQDAFNNVISLRDTLIRASDDLSNNYYSIVQQYDLDFDGDFVPDLTFEAKFAGEAGSKYGLRYTAIIVNDGFKVAVQKEVKYVWMNWDYPENSTREVMIPEVLSINDTVSGRSSYLDGTIYLAYQDVSAGTGGARSVIKIPFWLGFEDKYIGIFNEDKNILGWVKLSVNEYQSIVLHSYKVVKNKEELVISE